MRDTELSFALVGLLALSLGLGMGYRIGVHSEARSHRVYIQQVVSGDSDENCAGPCESTDR